MQKLAHFPLISLLFNHSLIMRTVHRNGLCAPDQCYSNSPSVVRPRVLHPAALHTGVLTGHSLITSSLAPRRLSLFAIVTGAKCSVCGVFRMFQDAVVFCLHSVPYPSASYVFWLRCVLCFDCLVCDCFLTQVQLSVPTTLRFLSQLQLCSCVPPALGFTYQLPGFIRCSTYVMRVFLSQLQPSGFCLLCVPYPSSIQCSAYFVSHNLLGFLLALCSLFQLQYIGLSVWYALCSLSQIQ